ncbi:MAG TPA: hypothetical protein VJS40_01595, partial [Aestuariivirgaceae bacterium]|nr:hypothetical protein [Aestuariivirgaceae bacterium]
MGVELPTRGCNGGSSTKDVRKLVFVIGTLPERQEMLPRRTKEFVIVPTSFQLAGMAKSRWPGFYQITTNEEMIDDVRHVSTTMYLPPLSGDAG